MRLALTALVLAACVRHNDALIRDLESSSEPQPELDAVLDDPFRPVALRDGPVSAEFDFSEHDLPFLEGRLNGARVGILLDTGSTAVSLTGPAADAGRVYLPRRGAVSVVTPGDESPHRLAAFESLAIGPFAFGSGAAAVAQRESSSRTARGWIGSRYAIVGSTVLSHFRVTIDFGRSTVRLERHGQAPRPGTLLARVQLGEIRTWMLVDSGATRLGLEPWAAHELGLIDSVELERFAKRAGATGGGRRKTVRVDRMTVAGREFRRVRATVLNTFGKRKHGGRRVAGLLGLAGLGKLVWTLDYATRDLDVSD